MHADRLPVPALVRGTLAIAAGLALLLGVVQPAAATSSVPPPVALGSHRFGHLRAPDSIVAHADPSAVGFFNHRKDKMGSPLGRGPSTSPGTARSGCWTRSSTGC